VSHPVCEIKMLLLKRLGIQEPVFAHLSRARGCRKALNENSWRRQIEVQQVRALYDLRSHIDNMRVLPAGAFTPSSIWNDVVLGCATRDTNPALVLPTNSQSWGFTTCAARQRRLLVRSLCIEKTKAV
jgi:hypothetical protein